MILIEDLHQRLGAESEGVFRLAHYAWRQDRFGRRYAHTILEDRSGALPAYAWCNTLPEDLRVDINTPVHVQLSSRIFNGRVQGDIHALSPTDLAPVNPIQLLPRRALSSAKGAASLQAFMDRCPVPALQTFLNDVFADEVLACSFLNIPASQCHHHPYSGGLADHSLEVAELVEHSLPGEESEIRTLAAVAGLLHDIGKTRVLRVDGGRVYPNCILPHEALTLEILAPALKGLERAWADGACALRYLLTWQPTPRDTRPYLSAALALQYADRYSSATDARAQAFDGKPVWQRLARLDVPGPSSRFWRPRTLPALAG